MYQEYLMAVNGLILVIIRVGIIIMAIHTAKVPELRRMKFNHEKSIGTKEI